MIDDPIVEEVRRYRSEHAAQYDNDLKRIVEALREKERTSACTIKSWTQSAFEANGKLTSHST